MANVSDEVIRSSDNKSIKYIRSLRLRKVREAERAFVVEGVRAVEDALHAGGAPQIILVREDSDWQPRIDDHRLTVRRVESPLFDSLADTVTPQPVMAVFEIPTTSFPVVSTPLILIVDGIRDPGNLGTLLRCAAAAGASAVFLAPGTVDAYNGKAVRAGVGAQFRVVIKEFDEEAKTWVTSECARFLLAETHAVSVYTKVDWTGAIGLIIGSEAHGPTEIGISLATERVSIPLHNGVESLNASIAGAVMLFEADRQRRAL